MPYINPVCRVTFNTENDSTHFEKEMWLSYFIKTEKRGKHVMNYIIIYTLYTYRNVSFAAYVRTISLFDNHCQSNEVYVQGWIMIFWGP